MKLAKSSQIKIIDNYAINTLGIPAEELMGRSGRATADAVRSYAESGKNVLILAGKGNNGGDGYAAACLLQNEYSVKIIDIFSAGQKTAEGKFYLEKYLSLGGKITNGNELEIIKSLIDSADVIIDAIFGTGFLGNPPESLAPLANAVNSSSAIKIAVDVPLGINADNGSVNDIHIKADATVALSYMKPGLLSYPAKDYCGKIIHDTIGLPLDKIEEAIPFTNYLFDFAKAIRVLPKRAENTSKGSFGKTLLITGSKEYPGAGLLALESALRGGAGYVTQVIEKELYDTYLLKFPEALYQPNLIVDGEYDIEKICALSAKNSATLIGSGSHQGASLRSLTEALIKTEGGPLVIDASAINSLAEHSSPEIFKKAKRPVILTPHPLEFSRISGFTVKEIQSNRIASAKNFAREFGIILLLKGAATIITDGDRLYINSSGSSALAKAGSGDVLAGLLASILSYHNDPLGATAIAAYIHGAAGDSLAEASSTFSVTPSDLPIEIAKALGKIENAKRRIK